MLELFVDGMLVPSTRYQVVGNTIRLKIPLYEHQKVNIVLYKVKNTRVSDVQTYGQLSFADVFADSGVDNRERSEKKDVSGNG